LRYLNSINDLTLVGAVDLRLKEAQFLSSNLQNFADVLCKSELLQEIVADHRNRFTQLYVECNKESESFVQLQFCWHKYCSAFLLPRVFSLDLINLNEATESSLVSLRNRWLDLCEANDVTAEGNPAMISASSAIYALLLERARNYQTSLISDPESSVEIEDDNVVYFKFGGATLCDMFHLHYKQIKDIGYRKK